MNRRIVFAAAAAALVLGIAGGFSTASEPSPSPGQGLEGEVKPMPEYMLVLKRLVKMLVFGAAGLLVLLLGIRAVDLVSPLGAVKEGEEGRSTARAVLLAGALIALGILMHGALTGP
jgi:uncharacterized membrane protein YjfL (UPF0719 family)